MESEEAAGVSAETADLIECSIVLRCVEPGYRARKRSIASAPFPAALTKHPRKRATVMSVGVSRKNTSETARE